MFPADRARKHIECLERKHDIEVRIIDEHWKAEASAPWRQVWIPDPTTALKYLICLHEFGHVLDKVSGKVMRNSRPECEAAAWRWAVKHARPDLLAHMTKKQWSQVARAWLTSVTLDGPPPW